MNEQIVLSEFTSPEAKEQAYIYENLTSFENAVVKAGGEKRMLAINSVSDKKGNGYTSVSVANFTAFRLRMRKGKHYIAIPTIFEDLIPDSYEVERIASDLKYFRLMINEITPITNYTDLLVCIVGAALDRYPTEWGCCSRYEECSDNKICVHPDKSFALSCAYRKKLNSGQVFYGKNRNI